MLLHYLFSYPEPVTSNNQDIPGRCPSYADHTGPPRTSGILFIATPETGASWYTENPCSAVASPKHQVANHSSNLEANARTMGPQCIRSGRGNAVGGINRLLLRFLQGRRDYSALPKVLQPG